jgi:hypothetical protein
MEKSKIINKNRFFGCLPPEKPALCPLSTAQWLLTKTLYSIKLSVANFVGAKLANTGRLTAPKRGKDSGTIRAKADQVQS